MRVKSSLQIVGSIAVLISSVLISYIGINESIIGYITFINRNYGVLYGGEPIVVNISSGQLRGFHSTKYVSRDGRPFYEFLGIPFAKPPVGELRFKPPVKIEPWEGVRDASSYGSKCWQFDAFIHVLSGDEDCLYLNVFTPQLNSSSTKLLPVIVFIHGGLFMFGRVEMFRPEYMMDEDIVLVQIHYRLGAFGFLNVNEDIRGNMGLKDQVLALNWVQENIDKFGGDPKQVTLLGESAGGSSIHMHMLSPLSKGLFHKAITMSGTALNHWSFNNKPKEQALLIGSRLGCPTNDMKALAGCLMKLDAQTIAYQFAEILDFLHDRLLVFAPTVESISDDNTFLADTPRNLLSSGKILTKVPWITGINSEEGIIYAVGILINGTCTKLLNSDWPKWAPRLFDYEHFNTEQRNFASEQILKYYMHGANFSRQNLSPIINVFSDYCFYYGVEESASLHVRFSTEPLYLYYYSYKSHNAMAQIYLNMWGKLPVAMDGILTNGIRWFKIHVLGLEEVHYGASHADELSMLFQYPRVLGVVSKTSKDYQFSKMLVKLWVSFAKSGKPELNGITWPAVTLAQKPFQYMELDNEPKVIEEPFSERLQFWRNLNLVSPIQPR